MIINGKVHLYTSQRDTLIEDRRKELFVVFQLCIRPFTKRALLSSAVFCPHFTQIDRGLFFFSSCLLDLTQLDLALLCLRCVLNMAAG